MTKIALVASEAIPYAKTGGLADVTGSLLRQFIRLGAMVSLFIPYYRRVAESGGVFVTDTSISFDVPLGYSTETCRIYTAENPERDSGKVYLIGNEGFFGREELYGTTAGDYPDNARRFTFFCRAVLETCRHLGLSFDVLHLHDWQTGIIPIYLKTLYREDSIFRSTKTVFTIHNMGYQGIFPASALAYTGLPADVFTPEGIEFFGKINLLKAGIVASDIVSTVSPTYAREILAPEKGFGLDGVLRRRVDGVKGILNGIDYEEWDPSRDAFLPSGYTTDSLAGKSACKQSLLQRFRLHGDAETPLVAFVGRLAAQKGIDLLAEVIDALVDAGVTCFILGKGDNRLQVLLSTYAAANPGRGPCGDKL